MSALGEDLARRQGDLAEEARRQSEQAESLDRQRRELSARATELTESRKNLKAESAKLEAARSKAAEIKQRLAAERAELTELKEELRRQKFETVTRDPTPLLEFDLIPGADAVPPQGEFDVLESTRHNKVFSTERSGNTLVVIPLGDASDFHYGDVHTESNKVRRLLEGRFPKSGRRLGERPGVQCGDDQRRGRPVADRLQPGGTSRPVHGLREDPRRPANDEAAGTLAALYQPRRGPPHVGRVGRFVIAPIDDVFSICEVSRSLGQPETVAALAFHLVPKLCPENLFGESRGGGAS